MDVPTLMRRVATVLAALLCVAAAVVAFVQGELAIGLLALAALCAVGFGFLQWRASTMRATATNRSLGALQARIEHLGGTLGQTASTLEALDERHAGDADGAAEHTARVAETTAELARDIRALSDAVATSGTGTDQRLKEVSESVREVVNRRYGQLRVQLEELPSAAGEYAALRSLLADADSTMPGLGGWALTSQTIVASARAMLSLNRPVTIVELGSGASTQWFARVVRERGGHVYSLEHDAPFARQTRAALERQGLDQFVSVLDAPLVPTTVGEKQYQWYDLTALGDLGGIDLLLVDGPPESVGPHRRYPAMPLLRDRLAPEGYVCLDDTVRIDERDIVEEWVQEFEGLAVLERLPKSVLLRWQAP